MKTTSATRVKAARTPSAPRGWSLGLAKEESKTTLNCQVATSVKADLDLLASHYEVPVATVADKILKHGLSTNAELLALKARPSHGATEAPVVNGATGVDGFVPSANVKA
jgi:hypothetical protein